MYIRTAAGRITAAAKIDSVTMTTSDAGTSFLATEFVSGLSVGAFPDVTLSTTNKRSVLLKTPNNKTNPQEKTDD